MADVLALIAQRRGVPRIGSVTDVAAGGVATVDVGGGTIDAQLTNETATVGVGALVAVLPIGDGDTWLIIASLSNGGLSSPVLGSNLVSNPGMDA